MLKLIMSVLVEAVIGLAVAAVVLAIAVPVMVRRDLIVPGDLAGSVVIAGVLVCAIGGMLFRPGSAINRYGKRDR
jgi:hypothetical protein